MQSHLPSESTESLATDARTLASPASIFSIDASETTTLRPPSSAAGSLASKSQETITAPKKGRLGMVGVARSALTPSHKSGTKNDKPTEPRNPLPEISRLLKQYKMLTMFDHRAKARKLTSITLRISTKQDYEFIEAITRLPYHHLPKFGGISVYVHEPYINKLKILTEFIERTSVLGMVWLNFCLRHDERRNKVESWKEGEDEALAEFLGALEGKDCQFLRIDEHRGIRLCQAQHPDGPRWEVSPSDASPEDLSSPPRLPSSHPAIPLPLSTLTALHISHPLMFTSPWLTYLTQTTNASALFSLNLTSMYNPLFQDWSSFLRNISVPSLWHLCISGELQRVDLDEFWERHQRVRVFGCVRDGETVVQLSDAVWGGPDVRKRGSWIPNPIADGLIMAFIYVWEVL